MNNLFNQPTIDLAVPIDCNISLFQINVYKKEDILLLTQLRIIQIVNLFADYPLVKL